VFVNFNVSLRKGEIMKRNILSISVILLFAVFMIIACGSKDKGPAELAIKAAEEALNNVKTEAAKIVPDQVAALESDLASAKDKMAKKEYKAALTEAQTLATKGQEVIAAAKAKKMN